MKLLRDEQVPARLSREFPEKYDVHTVQKMGWASTKNGELLKLAADNFGHKFVDRKVLNRTLVQQVSPRIYAYP